MAPLSGWHSDVVLSVFSKPITNGPVVESYVDQWQQEWARKCYCTRGQHVPLLLLEVVSRRLLLVGLWKLMMVLGLPMGRDDLLGRVLLVVNRLAPLLRVGCLLYKHEHWLLLLVMLMLRTWLLVLDDVWLRLRLLGHHLPLLLVWMRLWLMVVVCGVGLLSLRGGLHHDLDELWLGLLRRWGMLQHGRGWRHGLRR